MSDPWLIWTAIVMLGYVAWRTERRLRRAFEGIYRRLDALEGR
jgi:hypothetical protein